MHPTTAQTQTVSPACPPARSCAGLWMTLAMVCASPFAHATIKANNGDNLNLTTSWVGGTAPGASDVAVWNSTVSGANTVNLGASATWSGIQIVNPGGLVTIANDGNTLTNGGSGIDLSAATQNLVLSNNVVLGSGPQNWTVASGRTLALGARLLRNGGSGLRFYLPDLTASGAQVTLTNGTPNWMLGGTTNSTFGNIYFGTVNDVDLAALNGSMQVVGGSTIGGIYSVNTVGGANPTDNAAHNVASFTTDTPGVGWRFSGSALWQAAYLNAPQTYVGTGAMYYHGAPAWLITHTSGRNLTVYTVLMTTNLGTSALFDNVGATTIIGTAGTRDLLVYQNNPVAPYVMQTVLTETSTNTPAFLNKFGAGTMELENQNTYSGGTRVYEGTLRVDAIGNQSLFTLAVGGAVTAQATYGSLGVSTRMPVSAFLGWTNSVNVYGGVLAQAAPNTNSVPITVFSGATNQILMNAANLQVRDGTSGQTETIFNSSTNCTLTFNSGSHLQFIYNNTIAPSATVPALLVTNAYLANPLAANGTVTVDVLSGSLAVGQFPLIKYSGSIAGSGGSAFVLGTVAPHVGGYISNNLANGSIDLVITNTSPVHWATGNGTWDINSTPNWKDNGGNSTTYQEIGSLGDNVSFDDTYSGASPITVTLNASPIPGSVTFVGSKNYTLTGGGNVGGSGSVTVSGPGTASVQTSNSFTGGLKINGGILKFTTLTNLGGGGVNFGGGTLQYNGNSDDISVLPVTFGAGGGTIDTAGQTVSYANPVGNNGVGGLTKAGSGILTLNRTNRYTGNTIVSVGTLALGANTYISNSAAIIVNSSATLDVATSGVNLALGAAASQMLAGEGTVNGTVTAPASTTISPATNGTLGTLTLGNLTVSGGNLYLDVSTTSSHDLISVGNLTLSSGTVTINPTAGPLANGTYKLVQFSALASGAGSSGTLTVNYSQVGKAITLKDTASEIDLVVVDNRNDGITWSGTGTFWDVAGTMDWLTNGTATAWAYTNGDSVRFDDTGIGNTNVSLQTILLPGSVTVSNNAATPYTFADGTGSGGGRIGGSTSVVKDGPGTLVMNTANTYTGTTAIKAGVLQVGSGGIGDIGTGNVTNNGTLIFGQGDGQVHVVSGVVSGPGSLTQQGAATVLLAQNNTYSGPTTNSGALQVGTGGATGSLGTNTVTDNGTLIHNRSGSIVLPNNISGSGAFVKLGTSTLTFGGSLGYQGNTYVSNGLVKLTAANQIPNANNVAGSTGWLILDGGGSAGTFDLNGFNQAVNALSGIGGTVNSMITNSATLGTNVLTVGTASLSNTTTYLGLIADSISSAKIALLVIGPGSLDLAATNTYSGGTIVGNGATLTLGTAGGTGFPGTAAAGLGGITMSNGTTLFMNGNGITFPTNPLTIAPSSTVTFSSQFQGNGYSGAITGPASSTNVIVRPLTVQVGGVGLQYMGFLGTVLIPSGGSLRIYGSVGGGAVTPCGGTNTTFDLEGTGVLQTRTTEYAFLGALVGNGSITGPNVAANTGNIVVGTKNVDSTFSGIISGTYNIYKSGTARLTLNGATNIVITTDENFDLVTNYVLGPVITYTGNTTISNGVLALVAPNNFSNSPAVTLAAPTAVLDASQMGGIDMSGNLFTNGVCEIYPGHTLNGIGTIQGSVLADAGTTLNPGNINITGAVTNNGTGTGILNVTNAVSILGAVNLRLNLTNAVNADEIAAHNFTIDPAATITITNVGPPLTNAAAFQLFNHAVSFSTPVVLPPLTGTNTWVNNLAADGSITLVAPPLVTVNTNPGPIQFSISGGGTVLNLSWPTNGGWTLEVQTNSLAVGISTNWYRITNTVSMTSTNFPVVATNGAVFYRLVYP